jgi:DNA-binding LacI/PurR family transcriptional regulator
MQSASIQIVRFRSLMAAPGGERARVTGATVAQALGVSPSTVSNAYNRPDQLSPALRERILAAAVQLGYAGPDPLGRNLRRRRAGAIGVLFSERLSDAFADPAATVFLEGLGSAAEEAGYGLFLVPAPADVERPDDPLASVSVDGLVVYSIPRDHPLVAAALRRHLPAVTVDQPRLPHLPFVGIDDAGGARRAAEHLLQLGHRRFGVVALRLALPARDAPADGERQAAATFSFSHNRLRGYASALEAAGVRWSEVQVEERAHNTVAAGRDAGLRLLAAKPRPTAILCMSDQLAIGVCEAVAQAGLTVPHDLSVIGFDDSPSAAVAGLTTVRQPLREKGERAGRLLLDRLADVEVRPGRRLKTELVVRRTTAAPQGGGRRGDRSRGDDRGR